MGGACKNLSMTERKRMGSEYFRAANASAPKAIAVRMILGVCTSALLIIGALLGAGAGIICLALMGILLIMGWPRLLALPHPFSAGLVMSIVLLLALGVANWAEPNIMAFVLALSILLTFLSQMIHPNGRTRLLEQVSGTFAGSTLCVMLTLWNYTWRTEIGRDTGIVFAVVICLVSVVESVQARTSHAVAFLNAIVAGVLLAWLCDFFLWAGAAIGMVVVLCYVLLVRAMRETRSFEPAAVISRAMVPSCLLGATVYVFTFLVV